MKKLLLFIAAATMFAACSTSTTEYIAQIAVPHSLQISITDEESRIQLSNETTVWTAGDKVSVFYKSDANDCWRFDGKTGDKSGNLIRETQGLETVKTDKIVIAYPYNKEYVISPEENRIYTNIPATQKYEPESYGIGENIMVSSGDNNSFALKSVCGWLKLQFTGTGTVYKIRLKGNDNEQLAGTAFIDYDIPNIALISDRSGEIGDSEVGGTLVFDDEYITEITLDCGNEGIALSMDTATEFYITLVPQTFSKGISIVADMGNGCILEKSTNNTISIERNHIVPMAKTNTTTIPDKQIWYTSTDGKIVTPLRADGFGATIISNTYENGKGIISFDGEITSIGRNAFLNCSSLTSITIPDRVTSIESSAFQGCSSLTSVNIPDRVTSIGYAAFSSCSSLTSITIPDSVTSIRGSAFSSCSSLTSITIPDSVTEIGESVFNGCSSLATFYGRYSSSDSRCLIMDGKLIAFAPSRLTEYVIPNSVASIGYAAFYGCRNLTSVTIPDRVTSIESSAFSFCRNLTSIYCKAKTPPTIYDNTFYDVSTTHCTIYVPTGCIVAYAWTENWSKFTTIIELDF